MSCRKPFSDASLAVTCSLGTEGYGPTNEEAYEGRCPVDGGLVPGLAGQNFAYYLYAERPSARHRLWEGWEPKLAISSHYAELSIPGLLSCWAGSQGFQRGLDRC